MYLRLRLGPFRLEVVVTPTQGDTPKEETRDTPTQGDTPKEKSGDTPTGGGYPLPGG